MSKFISKMVLLLALFMPIASAFLLSSDVSDFKCLMKCSEKYGANPSMTRVIALEAHMTSELCCSMTNNHGASGDTSKASIFYISSNKSLIIKPIQHQPYYLMHANYPATILKQQINRDPFRHFFIKKHPIYLKNLALIC